MIRLDTTTRKLQMLLAGAPAATQPDILVCYADKTATAYTGGTQPSVGNGVTAVDICPAPAAATTRIVDFINVKNNDSASIVCTVRLNDNATLYKLVTFTLLTGETLQFLNGVGWLVLDVNGNRKEVTSSVFSSLTVTGTSALGVVNASGLITPNAGITVPTGQAITPAQVVGIIGTTTNNNAQAGSVGEFVESAASSTSANITSISLTAGDWDMSGAVYSSSGGFTYILFGISTTSGVVNGTAGRDKLYVVNDAVNGAGGGALGRIRVSQSGTTTYYLNAAVQGGGSPTLFGYMSARRVR